MPKKPTIILPPIDLGDKPIGRRIAIIRKNRGYSQRELAKKIGTLQTIISDYEIGRLRIYDEMIARISIALDVSTDTIIGLKKLKHPDITPSLKFIKRLKKIEKLPTNKQRTLLKTIDVFLENISDDSKTNSQ